MNVVATDDVTHIDAQAYALRLGEKVSESLLHAMDLADVDTSGIVNKEQATGLVKKALGTAHEKVTKYSQRTQSVLNDIGGIRFDTPPPPINEDRAKGILKKVLEKPYEKRREMLRTNTINFTQNVADEFLKACVKDHKKKGLNPKIIRTSVGGCCDFCNNLAGTYNYVPAMQRDVFRRHKNCKCTVEYYPNKYYKQDVHTKQIYKRNDIISKYKSKDGYSPTTLGEIYRYKDNVEYKQLIREYGAEFMPPNLQAYQAIKYNRSEKYAKFLEDLRLTKAEFATPRAYIGHYDTHANEFPDVKTPEDYLFKARKLLSSRVEGNVLGYDYGNRRVRYDVEENLFISAGKKDGRIITFFHPDEHEKYYLRDKKREREKFTHRRQGYKIRRLKNKEVYEG